MINDSLRPKNRDTLWDMMYIENTVREKCPIKFGAQVPKIFRGRKVQPPLAGQQSIVLPVSLCRVSRNALPERRPHDNL